MSPDGPEKVKTLSGEKSGGAMVLADPDLQVARALGVAFRVDDGTYGQLKGFGVDLEERSGRKHHLLPVPSVFILDTEGVIRFQYVNPDYRVRIDPETVLAAARAAL